MTAARGIWSLFVLLAYMLALAFALFASAHLLVEAARLGWGLVS